MRDITADRAAAFVANLLWYETTNFDHISRRLAEHPLFGPWLAGGGDVDDLFEAAEKWNDGRHEAPIDTPALDTIMHELEMRV
jgi:hypothetical protein